VVPPRRISPDQAPGPFDSLARTPDGLLRRKSRRNYTQKFICVHALECILYDLEQVVPTNLAIDDRLIDEARKLGHHRTKKEAVTAALDEYIRRRKQQGILSLFGTIDYDGS